MFAKSSFAWFAVSASTKRFGFGQLALLVGSSGLEPPTLRLSGVRSNHLSYEPLFKVVRVAWFFFLNPWWRWGGSNSWPPACKAGALPAELHPHKNFIRFPSNEICQTRLRLVCFRVSERRSSLFFLRILLGPSKSNNMQALNQALTG